MHTDKWHFTLRFLGQTAPSARDRLIAELHRDTLGAAFGIVLSGLGAFPTAARARVLWAGVAQGADSLTQLAEAVERACGRTGLASDGRPYSPHLTLSRLEPQRDLRRWIEGAPAFSVRATISQVVLMRSSLGKGPPLYESLARYELASAR